jgi:hypothetical protein
MSNKDICDNYSDHNNCCEIYQHLSKTDGKSIVVYRAIA